MGYNVRLVFGATTGGERRGVLESVTLLTCSPASLVFKASVASPTAALVNPLAPAYCTEQQCDHKKQESWLYSYKVLESD
jgi:hypothetical protein